MSATSSHAVKTGVCSGAVCYHPIRGPRRHEDDLADVLRSDEAE